MSQQIHFSSMLSLTRLRLMHLDGSFGWGNVPRVSFIFLVAILIAEAVHHLLKVCSIVAFT